MTTAVAPSIGPTLEQFILSMKDTVRNVAARRISSGGFTKNDLDDLMQEGNLALMQVWEKYHASKSNTELSRIGYRAMHNHILDLYRKAHGRRPAEQAARPIPVYIDGFATLGLASDRQVADGNEDGESVDSSARLDYFVHDDETPLAVLLDAEEQGMREVRTTVLMGRLADAIERYPASGLPKSKIFTARKRRVRK
jgi:RNA polymerase sigma factor (sigma-70 family)